MDRSSTPRTISWRSSPAEMLAEVLPAGVAFAATVDDPPGDGLFAEETDYLAGAVGKRRREFRAGRWCARRALAELGVPAAPLVPGPAREPVWPPGIVGSITHCDGFRAAAAARSVSFRAVGLDAEPASTLPGGVLAQVSSAEERARLAVLPGGMPWDRLLFSAKESVYKAWFPMTRRWLGFEEATLVFEPAGAFHAQIHPTAPTPGDPTRFDGRWTVREAWC